MELSKSHRLKISDVHGTDFYELLIKVIKRVLTIAQVYHLDLSLMYIDFIILVQIMSVLSEIDSLKVHRILYNKPRVLCIEERNIACSILNISKITKVHLEDINYPEAFFVLMKFCPKMAYLKMNYIHRLGIEFCLRIILKEVNNEHLRSLCFRIPAADDELIEALKEMIDVEKLLADYTIKRVLDYICLQWK
jgi:hypothetical protein